MHRLCGSLGVLDGPVRSSTPPRAGGAQYHGYQRWRSMPRSSGVSFRMRCSTRSHSWTPPHDSGSWEGSSKRRLCTNAVSPPKRPTCLSTHSFKMQPTNPCYKARGNTTISALPNGPPLPEIMRRCLCQSICSLVRPASSETYKSVSGRVQTMKCSSCAYFGICVTPYNTASNWRSNPTMSKKKP
jgi:hypothetical protein